MESKFGAGIFRLIEQQNSDGMPRFLSFSLVDLKLTSSTYNFTEAFDMKTNILVTRQRPLKIKVNPHGINLYIAKEMHL